MARITGIDVCGEEKKKSHRISIEVEFSEPVNNRVAESVIMDILTRSDFGEIEVDV